MIFDGHAPQRGVPQPSASRTTVPVVRINPQSDEDARRLGERAGRGSAPSERERRLKREMRHRLQRKLRPSTSTTFG